MSNDQVVVLDSTGSGGDGGNFFGLLVVVTLVFAILKVNHSIEMSWWLVTLPLWVCFVIAIAFMVVVMLLEGTLALLRSGGKK